LVKSCSTKSVIFTVAIFLTVAAFVPLAQARAIASPNDLVVGSPSHTVVSVSRADPSVTITINIEGPVIDIGVNDQYLIGDEYTVTLDGNPLFRTSDVPQPNSTAVCPEGPPGNLASCAAQQAAGEIVQTGYGGCDLATAFAAGLSWGDFTPVLAGIHTIVITDVSSAFTGGSIDSPSSLCVSVEPPPSFTTPEFPLGTTALLAVAMIGFVLVRTKLTGARALLRPRDR
jgi:hypothetical protein